MCGICGKVNFTDAGQNCGPIVERMANLLAHRGPDDAGLYCDSSVALGHRRLSIIDLSTGKQPISNEDRNVWTVFNGEIYNFRELRRDLLARGHRFATATDTEVIVHLYEEYGESCVSQLQGMFAFAIWDRTKRRLLLARDRVGIKPLYYAKTADGLMFASELKSLLADPQCPREIDPLAIDRFLTFRYAAGSETLLKGICKVDPGHYLTVTQGGVVSHKYWDLQFPAKPHHISLRDAKVDLIELLDKTVQAHMISDVPVGVLLSGGIDSCGVLNFAAKHSARSIQTFTIGFDSGGTVDERPYARSAAEHYRTDHHEMTITPDCFRDFIPKYIWHMEEPVCEPPAIALYYVTKMARKCGVKVVLSGEGGDEAFGGYNTYRNLMYIERLRALSAPWRQVAAALARVGARVTRNSQLARFSRNLSIPLSEWYFSRTANPDSYFHRSKGDLYTDAFLSSLTSNRTDPLAGLFAEVRSATPLSQMLYIDTKTWLPDDLLIKADKMTMANSVELRVPLLDHRVLEFAARLPDDFKVRGGKTKYILKQALRTQLPREVIRRPKTGFTIPVARWLAHDVWDFVRDVLTDARTYSRGYWNRTSIERLLAEHRKYRNRTTELFSLVVLELWHRAFLDRSSPACEYPVSGNVKCAHFRPNDWNRR